MDKNAFKQDREYFISLKKNQSEAVTQSDKIICNPTPPERPLVRWSSPQQESAEQGRETMSHVGAQLAVCGS